MVLPPNKVSEPLKDISNLVGNSSNGQFVRRARGLTKEDTTTKVQIKDRLNGSILKENIMNVSADYTSKSYEPLKLENDFTA